MVTAMRFLFVGGLCVVLGSCGILDPDLKKYRDVAWYQVGVDGTRLDVLTAYVVPLAEYTRPSDTGPVPCSTSLWISPGLGWGWTEDIKSRKVLVQAPSAQGNAYQLVILVLQAGCGTPRAPEWYFVSHVMIQAVANKAAGRLEVSSLYPDGGNSGFGIMSDAELRSWLEVGMPARLPLADRMTVPLTLKVNVRSAPVRGGPEILWSGTRTFNLEFERRETINERDRP